MENLKCLFRNYLYNSIIMVSSILIPIITFPYISRILTPYYLGQVNFGQSIVFYFFTIARLGVSTYGMREISQNKNNREKIEEIFTKLILINLFSSICAFLMLVITVVIYKKIYDIKLIILLFGFNVLTEFLSIEWFFNALEKYKIIAKRTLFIRIIQVLCIFLFIKTDQDYMKYVIILVLVDFINKLINVFYAKDYLKFKFFNLETINYKSYMKSIFIIFFTNLAINLYLSIDSSMLGILKGPVEVGLYTSATKMTKLIIPFITTLGLVLSPKINFNIKNKDEQKIFENMDIYLDFIVFTSFPIMIYLFLFSKEIILLFSGKEYLAANLTMKIMLPIILFISLNNFTGNQVLVPTGNEKKILYISILGLVINIVFNIILIPKFGMLGAANATVFSEFFVCIMRIYFVKKIYPNYLILNRNRLTTILASFSFFIIYILLNYFNINLFEKLILNFLIMLFNYLLILKFLKNNLVEITYRVLLKNKKI